MVNNKSRREYRKCRQPKREETERTEWRRTYISLQLSYGSRGIKRLFDDRRDGF